MDAFTKPDVGEFRQLDQNEERDFVEAGMAIREWQAKSDLSSERVARIEAELELARIQARDVGAQLRMAQDGAARIRKTLGITSNADVRMAGRAIYVRIHAKEPVDASEKKEAE